MAKLNRFLMNWKKPKQKTLVGSETLRNLPGGGGGGGGAAHLQADLHIKGNNPGRLFWL